MLLLQYLKRNWIIYSLLLGYFILLLFESIGYSLWLPSCPISTLSGHECMGCGMNHAFIDLLHGDFHAAFEHNKLIFIWLPGLIVWMFYDYNRFTKSLNTNTVYDN